MRPAVTKALFDDALPLGEVRCGPSERIALDKPARLDQLVTVQPVDGRVRRLDHWPLVLAVGVEELHVTEGVHPHAAHLEQVERDAVGPDDLLPSYQVTVSLSPLNTLTARLALPRTLVSVVMTRSHLP
jgi:predicted nucleic acid-binding OB-fold protein